MTKKISWDFWVCVSLTLAAATFILYRIFNISFTGDEWGMWKDSIRPGLEALITFQHRIPQSHFFQGLFAMPFLKYLPFHPAESVRIPSLLMFLVYAWSCIHLTKFLSNSWFRILFFCAWICPQVLIDYFGMARGYSFMMAFCGASLVGLIEAWNPNNNNLHKERWTKFSILSAAIALLALLTFSYGYLIISILLLLRYFLYSNETKLLDKIKETINKGSFIIWTGITLFVFYLPRYLILRHCPDMQWGGTHNFISDTFTSLLNLIDCQPQDIHHILNYSDVNIFIVLFIFALCLLNFILACRKKSIKEIMQSPIALASIIFFGVAIIMQVLWWTLDMQLPIRRTVLYLWPLLVINVGFSVDDKFPKSFSAINFVIMLFVIVFSLSKYNVTKIVETNGDSQNRETTNALIELANSLPEKRPLIVGLSDALRYTIWYYLEYEHGMEQYPVFKEHPVFRLYGNKIFLYSLSYGYPQPFPHIWHHFPFAPDYYLLSPYEPGQQPDSRLMKIEPVYKFNACNVTIHKAKKVPEHVLGCNVKNCFVCKALYQIASTNLP